MKISILAIIICWICIVSICAAQIGKKTQQEKIYGIWQNNDFGYQMTLILNADGSGEFDGEPIHFSIQGSKLNVTADGITTSYLHTMQGSALTLSGGDLEQPITFKKQGEQSSAISQNTKLATGNVQKTVGANASKDLLGIWSGYNETIEFKANAKCIYRGQTIPYTVAANVITLSTAEGDFMMTYTVNGNQLNLHFNNQNFTYTKNSGTSPTTKATAGGKNKLDVTLVGQWCYMNVYSSGSGGSSTNECIKLKEDGTYEYSYESSRSVKTNDVYGGTASQESDRGTWWVEGNKIFYNSATKGQGSYELVKRNHPKTNDAMIVLDGRTFVTFYNRPSW
jgi:hypothetical protein